MTDDTAYQIIARGPRLIAEAAARAVDEDAVLESTTYSILEEDEDHDVWRIDAFPTTEQESAQYQAVLGGFEGLVVTCEKLADADWLAMALSGLPPVRAGRFFIHGVHDRGRAPVNSVNLRIEAGAAFGTGHHGTTPRARFSTRRTTPPAWRRRSRRGRRTIPIGRGAGATGTRTCGALASTSRPTTST